MVIRSIVAVLLLLCFSQLNSQDISQLPEIGKHKGSNKGVLHYIILPNDFRNKKINDSANLFEQKYYNPFADADYSGGLSKTFAVNDVISLTITTTNSTCGYANGSLVAVASGGTPPYTFDIGYSTPYKTGNFPRLSAGNYTLKVTDAAGQSTTTNVVIGNTNTPVSVVATSYVAASGCASSDASVTLQASGGLPPYEYSMDGVNYQSSNKFSNFYPGLYIFFARDANDCIGTYNSFNLGNFINRSCDGTGYGYSGAACGNTGFISVKGWGVHQPYTYSIDGINYQSSGDYNGLSPGMYPIHFKDATGAIQIVIVPIYPLCSIQITYLSVDAACGQNDGSITVTAENGAAPYTYSIDGLNYQPGNMFTGLAPGNYFVTVRDANGVLNSVSAVVYDRCPTVNAKITDESCAKNDGTIQAIPNKGTAPYLYSLDGINFQSGTTFTGLTAGSYTVTIKDVNGFTSTTKAIIKNVCLHVTAQATDSKCGKTNGSISATADNGTSPYQFSIDGINYQSSGIFTGLAPGSYTVSAKDPLGKTGNAVVNINDVPGPSIIVNVKATTCKDNDGSITIVGSAGLLPYAYSIDGNSFQPGNSFNALKSGSYVAYIKDGNGCINSFTTSIDINCPLISAVVTDETCGSKNGGVQVSASKGSAPYEYSIDGISFSSAQQFSALSAGDYTVSVKDALGTVNTTLISIKNICPTVKLTITNGKCTEVGGQILCEGNNGYAPYEYSLDGINFQQPNVFAGLTTGQYIITVKDSHGLTSTAKADVQNFPSPKLIVNTTSPSCLNNDGKINLSANGGTAPLNFSIGSGSFQSNGLFESIAKGNYSAEVTDANGCKDMKSVVIDLLDNLILTMGSKLEICEGSSIKLSVVSNASTFNWSPSMSIDNGNNKEPIVAPLQTTTYTLTASLGQCSKKESVIVVVNQAPFAITQADTTICFGQSVQLSGRGGVSYKWTPGTYLDNDGLPNPVVMTPKSSISYSLTVEDAKGCTSLNQAYVKVTVTPPAKLYAGKDTAVMTSVPFQLKAEDINNSGFVDYAWSPANGLNNNQIQNPIAILDHDQAYTVVAKTQAGCEGIDQVFIKVYKGPEIYVPTAFTPNSDGKNDLLRSIPVGIKLFKYFAVYNRFGNLVFYSPDPQSGWNGLYNTTPQPSGVFVWIAEGIDDKGNRIQRKGTVMLIR